MGETLKNLKILMTNLNRPIYNSCRLLWQQYGGYYTINSEKVKEKKAQIKKRGGFFGRHALKKLTNL